MNKVTIKTEYTELINMLSDAGAGILLKALMQYARDGYVEGEYMQYMENSQIGVNILFEIIRRDNTEREDCNE
jgi:hypothetical protein